MSNVPSVREEESVTAAIHRLTPAEVYQRAIEQEAELATLRGQLAAQEQQILARDAKIADILAGTAALGRERDDLIAELGEIAVSLNGELARSAKALRWAWSYRRDVRCWTWHAHTVAREAAELRVERDAAWQAHDAYVREAALQEYGLRRDLERAQTALERIKRRVARAVEFPDGDPVRDVLALIAEGLGDSSKTPQEARRRDSEPVAGEKL